MQIFHAEDADVDGGCGVGGELGMSEAESVQDERPKSE